MNSAQKLLQETIRGFRNPPKITPAQWAEKYRRLSSEESAYVGRWSFRLTPWWQWFLERWAQPDVKKGVSMKGAQAGWTQGVVCNVLGHMMHADPASCIAMFPKEGSARNFDREKFDPMVQSTPELNSLAPAKSRSKNVTALFKKFPGGFVKFVGSNSIADVKSTSAKRLIIEEPDDCNLNLRGQGDAIKLLEERGKTYRDLKVLIGGTPSIKGVSSIEDEMLQSDGNHWMVPCPGCGEYQRLEWEQVRWLEDAPEDHPIYGRARPETARYCCVACGMLWTDAEKARAVQLGRAEPTLPFRGVLGLYINELYAVWHESRMQVLVERYLTAKHEEAAGNIEALIVFYNAALGRSWEHQNKHADDKALLDRGLDYPALTVPAGGLVLTAGVDVQHDRLAVIIRAWGRGEESWLVLFDEIEGNCVDKNDAVWGKLDGVLFGKYRHAFGPDLPLQAVSIDSGDGTTTETVYGYVRSRRGRGVELMAVKGSQSATAEIFKRAAPVLDSTHKNTKAAKHGLRPFMVGVSRAKDLLLGDNGPGRLALEGEGPGRFHWYKDVRADYIEQLTSEVKVPVRGRRGLRVWQLRKGRRNEVLDAENYALHASRAIKVHLARESQWQAIEAYLRQQALALEAEPDNKGAAEAAAVTVAPPAADAAPPTKQDQVQTSAPPAPRRTGGWVTGFRH